MINKLIQCDCMEYMKTCKNKQFDLAIVDPPYGLLESGGQTGGHNGLFANRAYKNGIISAWDNKPPKEYFDELFRVSKNQIIWGGNYFDLPPSRCFVVWDKVQPWDTFSACEYAWTSFSLPAKLFKFDNRTGDKIHPTQKPVALYKWLLSHYAHAGDKLFDSHSGSGSFRIAAYDMGFDLISCEIDADYCHDNEARYQAHIAQQELIPVQEIQQLTFGEGKIK